MKKVAILACDEYGGIGRMGRLPWPIDSADMKFFKQTTKGSYNNVVIMGRKTMESLKAIDAFPLPDRDNVVMTCSDQRDEFLIGGMDEVDAYLKGRQPDNAFVIGGGVIYHECFQYGFVDEILITRIPGMYSCDTKISFELIKESYQLEETFMIGEGRLTVERWIKL